MSWGDRLRAIVRRLPFSALVDSLSPCDFLALSSIQKDTIALEASVPPMARRRRAGAGEAAEAKEKGRRRRTIATAAARSRRRRRNPFFSLFLSRLLSLLFPISGDRCRYQESSERKRDRRAGRGEERERKAHCSLSLSFESGVDNRQRWSEKSKLNLGFPCLARGTARYCGPAKGHRRTSMSHWQLT